MKLDGLRVLDLSRYLPGPLLTQMMADHGAEVIKIEAVDGGDPTREVGRKRDGVSVFYANTNRGKKSVALNLKMTEGREAALRLAEKCDVVVESFRPGGAAKLGLAYAEVAKRAPRVVYASISAFGHSGPNRHIATHDLTVEAAAGVLSITRGADGAPVIPGLPASDILSATIALNGILMALLRREHSGRGDHVDIAMADCVLAGLVNNMDTAMISRRPPDPSLSRSLGGNALYALYATSDGSWLALGSQEGKFARTILSELGRPDLIAPALGPPGPGHAPVRAFLTEAFASADLAYWTEFFAGKDVPIAPVRSLAEVLDDPHFRSRNMVLTDARGWDHLGTPISFLNEPGCPRLQVPALGEHSGAVLGEAGFSDAEIARAVESGAVRLASEAEIALHLPERNE